MNNKTKLSNSKKLLYAALILAGIAHCFYMIIIDPIITSITETETSIAEKETQLSDLEVCIVNKEINNIRTKENNDIIKSIVDSYVQTYKKQDIINYFAELEKQYGLDSPIVAFGETTNLLDLDYAFDESRNSITANSTEFSVQYNSDYSKFRKYLKSIEDNSIQIKSMTMAFEPKSAQITGNITFSKTYIEESNNNDTGYNVDSIRTGVRNLFGNYKGE